MTFFFYIFSETNACLVCMFKQQFLVFLKIYVSEKVCKNTCYVI